MISIRLIAFSLLLVGAIPAALAEQGAPLSLQKYLGQVKSQNTGVKSAQTEASAARDRAVEAELVTSPTLFASFQYANDNTLGPSALAQTAYTGTSSQLGVSKLWDFGLTSKVSYTFGYSSPNISDAVIAQQAAFYAANPTLAPLASLFSASAAYTARPQLDLTFPLLGGFGGISTRATKQAIESSALMTSYNSAFSIKMSMAEAEMTYWRLALAREVVTVSVESLGRAEKIRDWNKRRAELNLADRSDYLQAEAAVKLRQLELEQAQNEERAAARAFNTLRGLDSNFVREQIELVELTSNASTEKPERARFREDVLAAREQSKLARAQAETGAQKTRPTLNLFSTLALNGRDPSQGTAIGNSFSTQYPTVIAGINLSVPLELGKLSGSSNGYRREQIASELAFDRKVFEQERSWSDLEAQLSEARDRLGLSRKIEKVQKEKLDIERDRHRRGRSTTYQVLLFEQDYAQAQLTRINAEAGILRILAQMKTFGGSPS